MKLVKICYQKEPGLPALLFGFEVGRDVDALDAALADLDRDLAPVVGVAQEPDGFGDEGVGFLVRHFHSSHAMMRIRLPMMMKTPTIAASIMLSPLLHNHYQRANCQGQPDKAKDKISQSPKHQSCKIS